MNRDDFILANAGELIPLHRIVNIRTADGDLRLTVRSIDSFRWTHDG